MTQRNGVPTPPGSSSGRRKTVRRRRAKSAAKDASGGARARFVLGSFLGLGLALASAYFFVVYPARSGPGRGREVEVVIERAETTASVVDKLAAAGLIGSKPQFAIYARLMRASFAPGSHLLTDDVSPNELMHRLERTGGGTKAKVTIPEGWNRFDIAKRLHAFHVTTQRAFLEATTDPAMLRELGLDGDSAEGFLFPATYEFPLDSDPREIVRRLKLEFDKRFIMLEQNHRLAIATLQGAFGWSRRDIVTLASMVEKEAAVDDERPIVASVFLNRMRDPQFKRKLLQCDPTSGYGCLALGDRVPSCVGYTGKITHAINVDPLNAYSTYVREGLPPGPIANPGIKSLEAVVAPAQTNYLYFVTRGEAHRHAFSETLDAHNAAIKEWRERGVRER